MVFSVVNEFITVGDNVYLTGSDLNSTVLVMDIVVFCNVVALAVLDNDREYVLNDSVRNLGNEGSTNCFISMTFNKLES